MSHGYHQQVGQPAWGPNQLAFRPPPTPTFQPSTWEGADYRTHAPNTDASLFHRAWDRVRHFDGPVGEGLGVGLNEAKHWHHRAYGGMNELGIMSPTEIGHAAAYEAYRTWTHNSSMYENLSGDIERQREGLIGLAVAEAARLLSFGGRSMDQYARSAASDAAAHTASYIFYQSRQGEDEYRSRSRSRSRSDFDDGEYDDPYRHSYPRPRSHSRHRSHSRPRSHSSHIPFEGTPYPTSASLPHGAYLGQTPSYGSYSSHGGGGIPPPITSYPSSAGPYYNNGMGVGSTYGTDMPSMAMNPSMSMNPSMYGSMPMGVSSSYPGSSVPMVIPAGHTRSGSSSIGYPQSYMGTAMSAGSMGMPVGVPQQTIVIHKSRRKHKHRHHRSRSRGSEPEYDRYPSSRY